jgi:hypothetical protein
MADFRGTTQQSIQEDATHQYIIIIIIIIINIIIIVLLFNLTANGFLPGASGSYCRAL